MKYAANTIDSFKLQLDFIKYVNICFLNLCYTIDFPIQKNQRKCECKARPKCQFSSKSTRDVLQLQT